MYLFGQFNSPKPRVSQISAVKRQQQAFNVPKLKIRKPTPQILNAQPKNPEVSEALRPRLAATPAQMAAAARHDGVLTVLLPGELPVD